MEWSHVHAHGDASNSEEVVMKEIADLDFGSETVRSKEGNSPQIPSNNEENGRRSYGPSNEKSNEKGDGVGIRTRDEKRSGKGEGVVASGLDGRLPQQQHHTGNEGATEGGRTSEVPTRKHDHQDSAKDKEKNPQTNPVKDNDMGVHKDGDKNSDQETKKEKRMPKMGLRHTPYQGGHMTVSVGRFTLCFQPLLEPYIDSCDWRIVGPIYSGTPN